MTPVAAPAAVYCAAVFVAGVFLGSVRTLWLAPQVGDLAAVAMELPVILAVSWATAGAVLRRWPVPTGAARLAMGLTALILLLLAEAALARAFGRSLGQWAASLVTKAGALGLAGQIIFALIPALRR